MTCFHFPCGKRERFSSESTLEITPVTGYRNIKFYTYKELRHATENFSPVNKIGEGGFGPVYKGKLRDGTMVAVKVLSPESRQGLNEFLTELTVLADVDHEYLVKLLGCCVEGDNRILVSRYLENNSLTRTLFGQNHNNINFSWELRRDICINIAKGLAFLHQELEPHIIHRDIKASNILLDKDLTAKISDFGLAKLIPSNMSHVSTKVAGTLGYLAPEYAIRGRLTRKADVYSFGVLLLEIVCGTCNRNRFLPPGDQYLLSRAWRMFERGELVELVDESFREDFNVEEASRFLKIAFLCTQQIVKLRPTMSTVVKMLQGEVNVTEMSITQPALLSDLTDVKVGDKHKQHMDQKNTSIFSHSSGNSSLPSDRTIPTMATVSFTSINARSD